MDYVGQGQGHTVGPSLARTFGRMNTAQQLSLAFLAAPLAIAMNTTSAFAKVSAEEVLCFQPGHTAIDEPNARTLVRLRDKARQLGRLEGIFVTTVVATPTVETELQIRVRGSTVMARLEVLGLSHGQSATDRFVTERLEDQGCPKGQVPVQVTLLFAEPAYLIAPPPK